DVVHPRESVIERDARLTAALKGAGVAAGDAVAVLARNDFVLIEANLALRRLDAYLVPINWHWRLQEVGFVLNNSGARILIGHSDLLSGVEAAIPADTRIVRVPPPAHGNPAAPALERQALDYDAWLHSHVPSKLEGCGLGSSM